MNLSFLTYLLNCLHNPGRFDEIEKIGGNKKQNSNRLILGDSDVFFVQNYVVEKNCTTFFFFFVIVAYVLYFYAIALILAVFYFFLGSPPRCHRHTLPSRW